MGGLLLVFVVVLVLALVAICAMMLLRSLSTPDLRQAPAWPSARRRFATHPHRMARPRRP